jgi:hypothetical protein
VTVGRAARSSILGALALTAMYLFVVRPWCLRWGATRAEDAKPLPGDELVPTAWYRTTHAITIQAPPNKVWAWLVQIGQGRGGFFTYAWLERLAGAGIYNVDSIVPELQHLAIGDVVPLSEAGGPTVVRLEPPNVLVLHDRMDVRTATSVVADAPDWLTCHWTWTWVLEPTGTGATRLVVRTRADLVPRAMLEPFVLCLLEPAHFIMERGMLLGIKRRAEL